MSYTAIEVFSNRFQVNLISLQLRACFEADQMWQTLFEEDHKWTGKCSCRSAVWSEKYFHLQRINIFRVNMQIIGCQSLTIVIDGISVDVRIEMNESFILSSWWRLKTLVCLSLFALTESVITAIHPSTRKQHRRVIKNSFNTKDQFSELLEQ